MDDPIEVTGATIAGIYVNCRDGCTATGRRRGRRR